MLDQVLLLPTDWSLKCRKEGGAESLRQEPQQARRNEQGDTVQLDPTHTANASKAELSVSDRVAQLIPLPDLLTREAARTTMVGTKLTPLIAATEQGASWP